MLLANLQTNFRFIVPFSPESYKCRTLGTSYRTKTHLEELYHKKESLIEEIATFTSILQVQENTDTEFINKNLETLRLQLSDVLLSIKLLEIKYEWLEAKRDALFAELWGYTNMDKLVEKEVPMFKDDN